MLVVGVGVGMLHAEPRARRAEHRAAQGHRRRQLDGRVLPHASAARSASRCSARWRRGRGRPPGQARQPGVAARQGRRAVGRVRARTRSSGNLPLVYPFLVNDPGEGTQAKRRAHAVVVDHLVPPMARAETYGDIARLEQLLDEYANIAALDPAKVPAVRAQIWTLIQAAQLRPRPACPTGRTTTSSTSSCCTSTAGSARSRTSQIRDGLHMLGAAPDGEARVNLVLAMLRARQIWARHASACPGCGEAALGLLDERGCSGGRAATCSTVAEAPSRPAARPRPMRWTCWRPCPAAGHRMDGPTGTAAVPRVVTEVLGERRRSRVLRLRRHRGRAPAAPDHRRARPRRCTRSTGGYVPAGPVRLADRAAWSTCCRPGATSTRSTPRPSRAGCAWEIGQALADSLLARHRADTGEWPRSVGLTVWGTSAMRTQGDDIAEVLALLGVPARVGRRVPPGHRPRGRPARRAGPAAGRRHRAHLRLLPRRVPARGRPCSTTPSRRSPALDEPDDDNYVRRARRGPTPPSTATGAAPPPGSSAPRPGAYGAGLLPLIDARNWRDDADLAEVYAVWGGYAYGRGLDGAAGPRRHGDGLPPHRGGGQERGHPRARHRRLRRLLPVPRRHGRDGPRT